MVSDMQRGGYIVPDTRRVPAIYVTDDHHYGRFIVGDPILDPVPQPAAENIGVAHKCFGRRTGCPAALVLKGLGQIPMIEGSERGDASRR